MSNRFKLAAAFLLLILTSCMVGPEYRRPVAATPRAFKEELPAGWKDAQPDGGTVPGKWWTVYNDPRLNAFEEQVSISNQNVLAAEAQFREAKAAISEARAERLPTVTMEPSATRSGSGSSSVVRQSYEVPFDLTYQADIWGSIRRTVTANSAIAQASAAELENARLLYQAELASDYFQIQGLDSERQLLESTVKSDDDYVQLTQDRYVGGVATMADVALAQTQAETVRAQLVDLQVERAQFEHAIAVLTGQPPSALSISPASVQAPPPVTRIGIPSALLERRPDIAAAERHVAAANAEIGIARAALFPALTFSASAGSQTTSISDLLSWPSRFWSVGPQLAAILFDGGKRRGQVRITQAAYDATVAAYRQTVLTAFQQVEDDLAELRVLAEEGETVARAVQAAQRSLDISTIQYRAGTANYLQVITAQNSVLQNKRSAVQILTRRMVAGVSLIQALGGGWDASQLPLRQ